MNASRSYSRSLSPLALQGESSPWVPILREPPIRRAFRLTQRRGWLKRHTAPRLPLPLTGQVTRAWPPLLESAFVSVGLKLCSGEQRVGEGTRPYG